MQSKLLSPREAAAFLGIAPHTLAVWRHAKRYPLPYIKVGSRVRYRLSDLEAFLEAYSERSFAAA